ncbi:MAG: fasciclin domain-containing protein [Bacteroidales bacterium]|nr:fasciclin domain-containing protein [Bacteroidales bacterium]
MRSSMLKQSKKWFLGLGLLAACGLTYSCSDDHDLDEKRPGFLGGSLYAELKDRSNFKTVLRLIEDLNYAEVLNKTGSKTLFVAPDSAYDAFFASTAWVDASGAPVRTYEQLTMAQKRLLFNGSMLDNAYLIEKLTTFGTSKNICLRQANSIAQTDSVPYFAASQLPKTQHEDASSEVDLWQNYNVRDKGMYLVSGYGLPFMTHFIWGQMDHVNVKGEDFEKVVNRTWSSNNKDVYIYNAKVIQEDITCLNGYLNVVDRVVITPDNMAEEIRINGRTKYFSRMLERFSYPEYNAALTTAYQQFKPEVDSVFVKTYYTQRSVGGANKNPQTTTVAKGTTSAIAMPLLAFDPAWNGYYSNSSTVNEDMAAIFVPTDEAVEEFFLRGGGRALLERYRTKDNTVENLAYNLDQIPLNITAQLINNLMKPSFNESVPTKYARVKNDARDDMFAKTSFPTIEAFKNEIDTTIVANNGVLYLTKSVFTPASFSSVIAPVLYSRNAQVINAIVASDDNFIQGSNYNSAPLKQYFSTYLKAMQSHFSFFVPTDTALTTYYDPASYLRASRKVYGFKYENEVRDRAISSIPVKVTAYRYNEVTGQKGAAYTPSVSDQTDATSMANIARRLMMEIVNDHIIIHDDSTMNGAAEMVTNEREYYFARSGAPIRVVRASGANGTLSVGDALESGWQINFNHTNPTSEAQKVNILEVYDQTQATNSYGNGMTYFVDRALQSTPRSVYDHIAAASSNTFGATSFGAMCQVREDLVRQSGLLDSASNQDAELLKYIIFTTDRSLTRRVNFFSNYRYTVYVPTDAAIDAAVANGLPTWESIEAYMSSHAITTASGIDSLAPEHKVIAQAQVLTLLNFLRYHFQNESVVIDKPAFSYTFETASYDMASNGFRRLSLTKPATSTAMQLTDVSGRTVNVVNTPGMYNVFARDGIGNVNDVSRLSFYASSSYSVLHQIDSYLNFNKSGGRFDAAWSSVGPARQFVKQNRMK